MSVFLTPCDLLAAILLQEWQLQRTPDGWGWQLPSNPELPDSKILVIWYFRDDKIQLKIANIREFLLTHRYLQLCNSIKKATEILEKFDVKVVTTTEE